MIIRENTKNKRAFCAAQWESCVYVPVKFKALSLTVDVQDCTSIQREGTNIPSNTSHTIPVSLGSCHTILRRQVSICCPFVGLEKQIRVVFSPLRSAAVTVNNYVFNRSCCANLTSFLWEFSVTSRRKSPDCLYLSCPSLVLLSSFSCSRERSVSS
jgi:hypothetical protein